MRRNRVQLDASFYVALSLTAHAAVAFAVGWVSLRGGPERRAPMEPTNLPTITIHLNVDEGPGVKGVEKTAASAGGAGGGSSGVVDTAADPATPAPRPAVAEVPSAAAEPTMTVEPAPPLLPAAVAATATPTPPSQPIEPALIAAPQTAASPTPNTPRSAPSRSPAADVPLTILAAAPGVIGENSVGIDHAGGSAGQTAGGGATAGMGHGSGTGTGMGSGSGTAGGNAGKSGEGTGDAEAAPISVPRPAYPMLSRQRGQSGAVLVAIEVAADGSIGDVSVLESSGFPRLDQAAIEAAKQAKFTPAKKEGVAVASVRRWRFRFTLESAAAGR